MNGYFEVRVVRRMREVILLLSWKIVSAIVSCRHLIGAYKRQLLKIVQQIVRITSLIRKAHCLRSLSLQSQNHVTARVITSSRCGRERLHIT